MPTEFSALSRLAAENYRSWKVPGPDDSEIASLLAAIDSKERFSSLTDSVDLGIARVLNSFAARMATLAARRNDPTWIKYGLVAAQFAMLREDYREVLPTYAILYRSAELVGVDVASLFQDMSYLAADADHETPEEFARRAPSDRSIEAMGYSVAHDRDGICFRSTI